VKGKKVLNPRNLELYRLVREKGGLPERGKRRGFWKKLCQSHQFKSPMAVAKAYRRLMKELATPDEEIPEGIGKYAISKEFGISYAYDIKRKSNAP